MSFLSWMRNRTSTRVPRSRGHHRPAAPHFRPRLEALETRNLLSTYYAATASDLIADINAANAAGGVNTIMLTAPSTSPYVLSTANNSSNGANAFPVISGGINTAGIKKKVAPVNIPPDNLTIVTANGSANPGYGDTIDASGHGRLFDVAPGASLTLKYVTLQNGQVWTTFASESAGGAILNQGTLDLSQVTVQNNSARGQSGFGPDAAGGGIWSNGSLTVQNCLFQENSAIGAPNSNAPLTKAGNAYGGAVCIAGGTANITGSFFGAYSLPGNSALGGAGIYSGDDGSAYGGAVYVGGGTVTLNADTIGYTGVNNGETPNLASGPSLSYYGQGYGGGVCVAGGTVTLTNDTIIHNVAGGYSGGGVAFGGYGYGSFGIGNDVYITGGATVHIDSFTVANADYGAIVGTYILLP
jgi:hypothetical protein